MSAPLSSASKRSTVGFDNSMIPSSEVKPEIILIDDKEFTATAIDTKGDGFEDWVEITSEQHTPSNPTNNYSVRPNAEQPNETAHKAFDNDAECEQIAHKIQSAHDQTTGTQSRLNLIKVELETLNNASLRNSQLLRQLKILANKYANTKFDIDLSSEMDNERCNRKILAQLHPDKNTTDEANASKAFRLFCRLYANAIQDDESSDEVTVKNCNVSQEVSEDEIIEIYQQAFDSEDHETKPPQIRDMANEYRESDYQRLATLFSSTPATSEDVKKLIAEGILTNEDVDSITQKQWNHFFSALEQQQINDIKKADKTIYLNGLESFQNFDQFLVHWLINVNKPKALNNLLTAKKYEKTFDRQKMVDCWAYAISPKAAMGIDHSNYPQNDNHAYINCSKYMTPLMNACCLNNLECVKVLFSHNADTNLHAKYFKTPLHRTPAALHFVNTPEMIDLFIANGVDLNIADQQGFTLLHIIANKSSHYFLEHLNQEGLNIEHLTAKLVAGGARLDARDNKGNTPFHLACKSANNGFILDVLLTPTNRQEMKASFTDTRPKANKVSENQQLSPIQKPKSATSISCLFKSPHAWLLKCTNKKGESPAHLAVTSYCIETVKIIAAAGADFNAWDAQGYTPVQSAFTYYLFNKKTSNKQYRLTNWLILKVLNNKAELLEILRQESCYGDRFGDDDYSVSIEQVIKNWKDMCALYREGALTRDGIRDKTPFSIGDHNYADFFSEETEMEFIQHLKNGDTLKRLVESAKTSSQKKRLDRVLKTAPAVLMTEGTATISIKAGTDTQHIEKTPQLMITTSQQHPIAQGKKGFFDFSKDELFDNILIDLSKLETSEAHRVILRYNSNQLKIQRSAEVELALKSSSVAPQLSITQR